MKINAIVTILSDEFGASAEGDRYRLPEGKKITFLIRAGDSVIPVSKVRQVRVTDEYLTVTTDENAFYIDVDAVVALRLDDPASVAENRPGFH